MAKIMSEVCVSIVALASSTAVMWLSFHRDWEELAIWLSISIVSGAVARLQRDARKAVLE